jgi:hypothetical protein
MDFKRLSQRAKRLIDKRGGTDSLKEDAAELRDIARGKGSVSDKAKAAADTLKEPGARKEPGTEQQPTVQEQPAPHEPPEPPRRTP